MASPFIVTQERGLQVALRPSLACYPRRMTELKAEEDAIAMRLRLALRPKEFTLTENQTKFQRFIQIQIPSFFGREASCTALRALRVSLIYRARLSPIEIVQNIHQLFLYLDLYMALGDENNSILIQTVLQKKLAHCVGFPELDWIRSATVDPELMPLLLQPRTFNPIAQEDLGHLSSPYQPLEFLQEMHTVIYDYLSFCKMHFQKAVSSDPALADLALRYEAVLPRLISTVSSLGQQLHNSCAICDRCRCNSPQTFFEERYKLFVEMEQIMTDLKAQFHKLSEIQEVFKNRDRESLPREKKLLRMYCIEMVQITLTMFSDFSEAMNVVMAKQKLETDIYKKELEHFHQIISVPCTYRGISYLNVFFMEFFSALSSLDLDQQTSLYQSLVMPFFWILQGLTATIQADFGQACAVYKTAARGLLKVLEQQLQEPRTERLKQLIEMFLPLLSRTRLHFFLQPVGMNRERGENDIAFMKALLKIATFLPRHLYNLAGDIEIEPALRENPDICEFEAIQKDLVERLLAAAHFIEESPDHKQSFMHLVHLMEKCVLSLDRLDSLASDKALFEQSDLGLAKVFLFLDNFKFFMLLLRPATTYGTELSLLEDDKDHAAPAAPKLYPFVSNHDSAAAKAAAPPADESTVAEAAAAAPAEAKQEPLAKLIGQLQQIPRLPPFVIGHYLVILHEMLHGPIFLWQPSLVAEEALSKCALLIEQIFKVRAKKETSSMHDLMALSAEANIPLAEDEKKLLKELGPLNVNRTYDRNRCEVLVELDRYMQMLDRLHRGPLYLSDEKFLQGQFGEQREVWIHGVEGLIARKIEEVKGLIEKTIAFATELSASFGSATIEIAPLSPDHSPRPNTKLLAFFQDHVEKLQGALRQLIRANATASEKVRPIAGEKARDINERVSLKAKYIENLHDILDHLQRALIFPSTNCERAYKTILATTIAKTLELVELIILIGLPIADSETGRHVLFSTVREKRFLHSHELQQFYKLLKTHLKLTQKGPIGLFENHLRRGARYPGLESELFLLPTDELLQEGFQVIKIALALLLTNLSE